MATVNLTWFPRALSPNARVHWATKAKAAKSYRTAAKWEAHKQIGKERPYLDAKPHLFILFNPPNRRGHDLDNCLAAIKSAIDGIADYLGINDRNFKLTIEMGEPVKDGAVRVEIAGRG